MRPQLREINYSSTIWLCSFLFLLVFFVAQVGISLLGEVNRIVTRLITRGDVVLRLQGLGLCDLKPDRCVALRRNDSYHHLRKIEIFRQVQDNYRFGGE